MAQVFRLVLRIQAEGQEVFKQTAEDVKKLNAEVQKTSTEPFERIEETTEQISENIQGISKQFSGIVKSVVGQTSGALTESLDNVSAKSGKFLESTLARVAVGVTTISSLSLLGVQDVFDTARNSSKGLFGFLKTFSSEFFDSASSAISVVFTGISDKLSFFKSLIGDISFAIGSTFSLFNNAVGTLPVIGKVLSGVGSSLGVISSSLLPILGAGSGLFLLNIGLKEAGLLFSRFLGHGLKAVTPLERITNIITVIDESFRSVTAKTGEWLKTITFVGVGIAGFLVNPLLGVVSSLAGVNSLISSVLNVFQRGKLQTLSFFGSSKAQIGLIILDLRNLAEKILPILADKAKAFVDLKDNAAIADKEIKKVAGDLTKVNEITAVKRANFPIQQQFAQFSLEVKSFAKELLLQLNKIFLATSKGLGISEAGVEEIKKDASSATKEVVSGIEKSSRFLDSVFSKSQKNLGLVQGLLLAPIDKLSQIGRGLFSGFTLTSSLKESRKEAENLAKQLQATQLKAAAPRPLTEKDTGLDKVKNLIESTKVGIVELEKGLLRAFNSSMVGGFQKAVDTLDGSINKIKGSVSNIGVEFRKTPASIEAINPSVTAFRKSIEQVGDSVKKIPENFTGLKDQIKTLSQEIFALQKAPVKQATPGKGGIGKIQGPSQALIDPLKGFSEGTKGIDVAIASLKNFEKIVLAVSGKLEGEAKSKIEKFQQLFAAGKFKVDIDKNAFKGLFDAFEKSLNEASKILGTKGKDLPGTLTKTIKQGLETGGGRAEVEKVFTDLTDLIAAFFPASPAKRGALRNIPKWGPEIATQLSQGMQGGKKDVAAGAEALAKQIAGFFPQSPALFGPLRFLGGSGLKIAELLANGIRSGVNLISDAANFIADEFDKTIKKAVNIEFLSQRVGVSVEVLSSFNSALATVGGSVQDLEFSLISVNKTLADAFSPEKLQITQNLGIDINKVRQSVNPSIELLLSVADILKDLPPQSKEFQQALELIGVTSGNSPLIPFLRKGREEILRLQEQGIELGTVYDAELTKMAVEFQGITNQAQLVRETLFNELIKQVLPNLIEFGNKVLEIIETNSAKIKTFFSIFGQLVSLAIQSLSEFIKFAIDNPSKASEVVLGILKGFARLASNLFDTFFDFTKDRLLRFLKEVALLLIELPKKIITNAFLALTDQIQVQMQQVVFGVRITLSDLIKELKPGVQSFLGLDKFVINDDEVAGIQDRIDKAKDHVLGFSESVDQSFDDAEKAVKERIGNVQKSFQDLINSDLKQNITGDVVEFINELSKVVQGTPLEGITDKIQQIISAKNLDAEIQKYEQIKDAQIKNAQEAGKAVEDEAKKVAKATANALKFTLISEKDLKKAREDIADIKGDLLGLREVENVIKEALDVNPFLGFELALKAFKNATVDEARFLEDELLAAFEAVAKLDPFFAMRESLKILQQEAGGFKEKVAAQAFNKVTGTTEFEQEAKESPTEAADLITQGIGATSSKNQSELGTAMEAEKKKHDEIANAIQTAYTTSFDLISQSLQTMVDQGGKNAKKFFIAMKAVAIANAIIQGVLAVQQALADTTVTSYVAKVIQAASAAALAAGNVATIVATTVQGFAEGGMLAGPSHEEGGVPLVNSKGKVFAEAEGGEFILSKKATAYAGRSFLEAVNNLQISRSQMRQIAPNIPSASLNLGRRFAEGGFVPPTIQTAPSAGSNVAQNQQPIQIVNVPDSSLAERYLASNRGERQILNIITNNSEAIKKSIGVR